MKTIITLCLCASVFNLHAALVNVAVDENNEIHPPEARQAVTLHSSSIVETPYGWRTCRSKNPYQPRTALRSSLSPVHW